MWTDATLPPKSKLNRNTLLPCPGIGTKMVPHTDKVTSQAQKFILNFDVTRGMYQTSHWRSQSKASHCASYNFNRIMNQSGDLNVVSFN